MGIKVELTRSDLKNCIERTKLKRDLTRLRILEIEKKVVEHLRSLEYLDCVICTEDTRIKGPSLRRKGVSLMKKINFNRSELSNLNELDALFSREIDIMLGYVAHTFK